MEYPLHPYHISIFQTALLPGEVENHASRLKKFDSKYQDSIKIAHPLSQLGNTNIPDWTALTKS